MTVVDKGLLQTLRAAQRLGLVASFRLKAWKQWYQAAESGRPISTIFLSTALNYWVGRVWIARNYGVALQECTPMSLLAHELGHVFQWRWAPNRGIKPLKGYAWAFPRFRRFEDPWNELIEYQEAHPDADYDRDRFISWYAWSDRDEDFAETFAEVVCRGGQVEAFKDRPALYRKMQAILRAGRRILRSDGVLRMCNARGWDYLFGGQEWIRCPQTEDPIGVPAIAGNYVCPCGRAVTYDGIRTFHTNECVESGKGG
jgi:hypothetical protein